MMKATFMYASDFNDLLVPNIDDGGAPAGYAWVKGNVSGGMPPSMSGAGISSDAGDPDILKDPKTCLLQPYTGSATALYKCPADPRFAKYTGSDPGQRGSVIPVVRSCSLNQGVGTQTASHVYQGPPTVPVDGPWLDGAHGHRSGQPYATFGKTTSFTVIGPSDVWTYVDDDPWTINDAAMAVIASEPQFVDYCSPMHNNACGFAFADGHSEVHAWKSNLFVHNGVPSRTTAQPGAQYNDWFWWASHATRSLKTYTVP